MLQNLTGWHALIILAIVVLIFGAAKLPALARSVGQSMRILKTEVAEPASAPTPEPAALTPAPVAAASSDHGTRPDIRTGE
ncbi:twin-arginine translocase TatA/TatE family subunit [Microbacterium sp. NPDC089695]|uniref:twin-arginine translocase TatA/TatE family subunit n=1 Tax=Microbacterium sp. NPDC089695 TaxID=3364198 RepID=UPI00380CEEA6